MDYWSALQELCQELQRIDRVIANLEALKEGKPAVSAGATRGRKSMPDAERRVVAERMRKYWASRRRKDQSAMEGSSASA